MLPKVQNKTITLPNVRRLARPNPRAHTRESNRKHNLAVRDWKHNPRKHNLAVRDWKHNPTVRDWKHNPTVRDWKHNPAFMRGYE